MYKIEKSGINNYPVDSTNLESRTYQYKFTLSKINIHKGAQLCVLNDIIRNYLMIYFKNQQYNLTKNKHVFRRNITTTTRDWFVYVPVA
jgi:hypothetical protein